MPRLDVYEDLPRSMGRYLSNYGWHFCKELAEDAVKDMPGKHFTSEQVKEFMKTAGFTDYGDYTDADVHYAFNMYYSDFYGDTLSSESKVSSAVNDIINDEDGYNGQLLTRYYADCIGKGKPLMWEKYI